jgi:hypothetical protein
MQTERLTVVGVEGVIADDVARFAQADGDGTGAGGRAASADGSKQDRAEPTQRWRTDTGAGRPGADRQKRA